MTTATDSKLDLGPLRKSIAPIDAAIGDDKIIAELLAQRRFNPGIQPPPLRPIYSMCEQVIATPGNLASITAAVKTGKSAVIGAMIASAMTESKGADLLGFSSCNPKSYALLHFDSEQSPDDHWNQVARALKRAGLREPPPWLYSYWLTGLDPILAWQCVREGARRAAELHGGIHSILIDGAADLVTDVNDPSESNERVALLHDMAIQYDCPIIVVIHLNPNSDKSRGHLGSQLERKAETNLRLDKKDGITSIWSDKQRRAPIPKGSGPCFQWSDEAGMHVTAEKRKVVKEKEEFDRLTLLAEKIFSENPSMRYADLVSTVMTLQKTSKRTAERHVSRMATLKVIRKSGAGLWMKGV